MKIRTVAFNIYLLAAIILAGCKSPQEKRDAKQSSEQKKQLSTIRFHLEATGDSSERAGGVPILRASPMYVNIVRESFLDERDVVSANLNDHMGSFVIQIQLDEHGTFVLDNLSAANKGKRIAIMCEFGDRRWLAAPIISRRMSDGMITFTPDATREEAERIVRGLNNAIGKLRNKSFLRNNW